jgi:hypothetical protein
MSDEVKKPESEPQVAGISTFKFKLEIESSRPTSPVAEVQAGAHIIESLSQIIQSVLSKGTPPIVQGYTGAADPFGPDFRTEPPPKWFNEVLKQRIHRSQDPNDRASLIVSAMIGRYGTEMEELSVGTFAEFASVYGLVLADLPSYLDESDLGGLLRAGGVSEAGISKIMILLAGVGIVFNAAGVGDGADDGDDEGPSAS